MKSSIKKAVILAAGLGSRLGDLTKEIPKCLIEINGRSLIDCSISSLVSYGIEEVIIVVGHKKEKLQHLLGCSYRGAKITYIENPLYETTGSFYSFYLAIQELKEDILLLESDIYYDAPIIDDMLKATGNMIAIASLSGSGDEVYVYADHDNKLVDLGKGKFNQCEAQLVGELIGITRLTYTFLKYILEYCKNYPDNKLLKQHYEEVINQLHNDNSPLRVSSVGKRDWIEIDTLLDLRRLKEMVT